MRDLEAPTASNVGEAFRHTLDRRGMPQIIRAARDPIQVPSDPVIVAIAEKNLCHLGLNQDAQCFSLTNVYGMTVDVPYGASVADWEDAAAKLLQGAMDVE